MEDGDGWLGVSGQNICYHAAAFRDFLLFHMQNDRVLKRLNFDLLTPPPKSTQRVRSKITFDMFHTYCTSVCMRNFSIIY